MADIPLTKTLFAIILAASLLGTGLAAISNGTIIVDSNNTRLSFTDSGPPGNARYTTIFAIHGLAFNKGVFIKVLSRANEYGFRFVAINRRGYTGSTPYTDEQIQILNGGTDAQRDQFFQTTGVEILTFIDTFIQNNDIPAISQDGKSGGVAVIGWSIGNMASLAAISNVGLLPRDAQARLASRIRTLIMQEPSADALGLPIPSKDWVPLTIIDSTIPTNVQYAAFAQWVTAYFDHGNLSSRDPNVISWVLPSISRPFSIFSMSAQYNDIVDTGVNPSLDVAQIFLANQLKANYRGANFNNTIRSMLPKMKNWFITGDRSVSFAPYSIWLVQDDNQAAGGNFVNFQYIHGVNHLMHWDEPVTSLQVYQQIINGMA